MSYDAFVAHIGALRDMLSCIVTSPLALQNLVPTQVDMLIKYYNLVTQKNNDADVQNAYLSAPLPVSTKVNAILEWSNKKVSITDEQKPYLVAYIKNTPDISYQTAGLIADLISQGTLEFTRGDIEHFSREFLETLLTCFAPTPSAHPKELQSKTRFLINLLYATQETRYLKPYMKTCHPSWKVFPQKIARFSGDLLPQLIAHYSTTAISPVVTKRRNVGILFNNTSDEFYDFQDYLKKAGVIFGKYMTIELPYMCYAYISHVEIDMTTQFPPRMNLTTGTDYLKVPFVPAAPIFQKSTTQSTKSLANKKTPHVPSTYLTLFAGDFISITGIRVYGDAISFI